MPGKPWPEADGEVVVADAARLVQHVLRLCEASIEVRFEFRRQYETTGRRQYENHFDDGFPMAYVRSHMAGFLHPSKQLKPSRSQPTPAEKSMCSMAQPCSTGIDVLLTT